MKLDELIDVVDTLVVEKTNRHLRDIDIAVLKGAWDGQKYEEIAAAHNYTPQYIKRDVGPKLWQLLTRVLPEKVGKKNVRSALERLGATYSRPDLIGGARSDMLGHAMILDDPMGAAASPKERDWGDVPDLVYFIGRQQELNQLTQWCIQEGCRLVAVLGLGGMGKTTLVKKLAQSIQHDYEFVIWRSLKKYTDLKSLLSELISFLSRNNETELPKATHDQVSRLISYLRSHRCLIVLDDSESILASGKIVGRYQDGLEGYQELFRAVGEQPHQSTVLLTGREKSKEISLLEGIDLPVRSLMMPGMDAVSVRALLNFKECYGSDDDVAVLADYCGANPCVINIVSSAMQELSGGDVGGLMPFIRQGMIPLDEVNDLLDTQWERLSRVERHIVYWLAINREPMTVAELTQEIVPETIHRLVPEAIQSLARRSFLVHVDAKITLQSMVIEYVSAKLVQEIGNEISQAQVDRLQSFALLKTTSPDDIQALQKQYLLQPVVEILLKKFSSRQAMQAGFQNIFEMLHRFFANQAGYAAGNLLNLMQALELDLTDLDLSELVVWQASLAQANLKGVNLSQADVSKSLFTSITNATLAIAFSPDGQWLATGHGDNKLRLRSVQDFREVHIVAGHSNWVSCLAFSADSKLVVTGSFDHDLRLWNVETGTPLLLMTGHQGWVWSVAFSPDGFLVASAGNDGTIRLWDTAQGDCIQCWDVGRQWIWSLAFSPDGTQLLSGGDDQAIKLWDVQTGDCLQSFEGHHDRVSQVDFCADGRLIASASFDKTVKIWNRQTAQCEQTLRGHSHTVLGLAISDAETPLLASAGQDYTIRLWNYQTGACLQTLHGHPSGIWSVAFHPDGDRLASCSNDGMVKLWSIPEGRSLRTVPGYSAGLKSLAVSSTQPWIATGGDDDIVKLWDCATGELKHRLTGHSRWVRGVTFAPNGVELASCGNDATIRIWDGLTGQSRQVLKGHDNIVYTLAYHPDGRQLASGGDDQTVRLWSLNTPDPPLVLSHPGRVWSVNYSPDGGLVAVGCEDQRIYLWDVRTQECRAILEGHENLVACVEFSPDGKMLASASDDRTIRLWDVATGDCLKILRGHSATVWTISFSPDGQMLASGSFDQTVRFWDWQAAKCLQSMIGIGGEVWSVAFQQEVDQRLILWSGNQQGQLSAWDYQSKEKLLNIYDQRPYEQMNIQNIRGLTGAQKQSLKQLGAFD